MPKELKCMPKVRYMYPNGLASHQPYLFRMDKQTLELHASAGLLHCLLLTNTERAEVGYGVNTCNM